VRSLSPQWVALIVKGTRHGTLTCTTSTDVSNAVQKPDSTFDMSACASLRVGASDVGLPRPTARPSRQLPYGRANIPSGCHGPRSARAATSSGIDLVLRRVVEPASVEVITMPY
jgi:hypothetical protein